MSISWNPVTKVKSPWYSWVLWLWLGLLPWWQMKHRRLLSLFWWEFGFMEYKKIENTSSTLALAFIEMLWLQSLLSELRMKTVRKPILYCDNISTKYLASNPIMHSRMKQVEFNFHFLCDLVVEGKLDVRYDPSEN